MDFNSDCEVTMIVRPHDRDNEDDWDDWGEIDRPPHDRDNEDDWDDLF